MRNLLKNWRVLLVQIIKFSMVGVLNTLVDLGVYALLTRLPFFAQGYYLVLANVISYTCGILCSLVLNKRWTFKQKNRLHVRQVATFLLINLVALALSSGVLAALNHFGAHSLLAKVLSLPFSFGVNFIGNKLFVFKEGE